ncbi:MAG: recombinase family protein [Anaerolineaceae bacterium]|nr:recombinase family protein [Anaerolineaceae bacterium]
MPEMTREQQRERVRRRVRAATDPENYTYFPEKENLDYVKSDEFQRVGIYARVSTDDPAQTSSFELQQKYYVDMVDRNPNWYLVKIYTDEGKSATTTQHREGFLEMMNDAFSGKLDLIIVKNISRLARNVVDFLSTIRKLREKKIGVLFESEGIYSLNSDSHLALSLQATVAEQESRLRSRSMETSLRMRLDHGLPLTPELLGFVKDENGKLVVNPETENIPRLMFYMYLYGYSTQQIADVLIKLCKKSYLGNIKWTAGGVARILRSERYCGDVLTRKRFKVFAPDADEQKSFKNNGEKPQSYYRKEHEQIVTFDDFTAVQRIMNNAKFGGTSLLPELRVIPDGLLKGFVIIHPKWGSFTREDYISASKSVDSGEIPDEIMVEMEPGGFDLRKYDVVSFSLFDEQKVPAISLQMDEIKFSMSCVRGMACDNYVELMVHPTRKMLAIRPAAKDNRCAIYWASGSKKNMETRKISCKAYIETLFQIFEWKTDYKYKLYGCIYRDGKDSACIFTTDDASVYINKEQILSSGVDAGGKLLNLSGKRVRTLSGNLGNRFGQDYYAAKTMHEMMLQTREQWQTRIEGQLCATGDKLNVTPYDELRTFIRQELGDLFEEVQPE